jgi:hypothetical protein
MSAMSSDEATGSWLERATAQAQLMPATTSEFTARAPSGSSSDGWDPYDVWLRPARSSRR